MRNFLFYAVILNGAVAMAQPSSPFLQNRQQTTGVVGVTSGQTARLTVVYPTAPAPILQILCSAALTISDDQGKALKTNSSTQLVGGKSFSIDVNADTDLAGTAHTGIYGFSVAPIGCQLIATLQIIDNVTQKTLIVVGSKTTYPVSSVAPATTVPPEFTALPAPGHP
jgi:hypothetical protein